MTATLSAKCESVVSDMMTPAVAIPNLREPVAVTPPVDVGIAEYQKTAGEAAVAAVLPPTNV